MSISKNEVTLKGNVGKQPQLRVLPNNTVVCEVSLATTSKWTDRQTGQSMSSTEWHNVLAYDSSKFPLATTLSQVPVGTTIEVSGTIKHRKFINNKVAQLKNIFLRGQPTQEDISAFDNMMQTNKTEVIIKNFDIINTGLFSQFYNYATQANNPQQNDQSASFNANDDFDDDIPF